MSAKIIYLATRRTRRADDDVPITEDALATEDRLRRSVSNLVIEAETLGVPWARIERWFATALFYIRSKIAQKELDL